MAEFRLILLQWWIKSKRDFPWRRSRASLFHQVVSEVLLQRTRADKVAAFWPAFITRFPTWQSIAAAPVQRIERTLKPIGLSKQRAPRLKGLATTIAKNRGQFPADRKTIEALPGVGQYIANAIDLFANSKPSPLVDVNMARVLERYFGARKLADIRYDPYLQELAMQIVSSPNSEKINWAILDFAALTCTVQKPKCITCPLAKECDYLNRLSTSSKRPSALRRIRSIKERPAKGRAKRR